MNKREFMKGLGAVSAAGALAGAAGVARAQEQSYKWRMAMSWPDGMPVLHHAAQRYAENVKKMSAGRIDITIDSPGKHKAPLGIFDMVRTGAYELGHTTSYYYKGKEPVMQFFTTVPFGMTAMEQNAWFYYGGGLELMQKAYARHNIVVFNGGNTHVQMGGWFKKEVKSLKDLQGLKMRIPGFAGEVVARVGMKPTNIPAGELYTSLERGAIDAVEWVGPALDAKLGFQKIAKFYYTGWHEPAAEFQVFVNKDKYESLPEDLKTILAVAAKEGALDSLSESFYQNMLAWEQMLREDKVKIRTFPKDVIAAFRKATGELLDEMAAQSPEVKEVIASQKAFMQQAKAWTRITDENYLALRG